MTKATRPVKRETYTSVREAGHLRPLVIELHATHIRIRLKGMRRAYVVTYDQVWTVGAKNEAEARREAKAEARKQRRSQ